MTIQEKRQAIVNNVISREGKNQYTQGSKRLEVESGYSDCSSLTWWAHKKALSIDIGDDTVAQVLSKNMQTAAVTVKDGIPDESALRLGDLLFFRGTDTSRSAAGYVGHVETYVGGGETSGHGSGIGPTRKNMKEYCAKRQGTSVPSPIHNRGLICVRRAVPDDGSGTEPAPTLTPAEKQIQGIQSWVNAYLEKEIKANVLVALELDGHGGPLTRKALCMCLQKFHNITYSAGLAVDGSFGPATRKACRAVKKGRKDDLTRVCQGMLYCRGYDPNGFDGSCGSGCDSAIRRYQKDKKLSVDGSCGPATFYALFH